MSNRKGFVGGLAALFILCSAGAARAAEEAAPANLQELDSRLEAVLAKDGIPGASVALVEKGEIVFARGYGLADKDRKIAATEDTPFRAGSISKAVTAIAVMSLVEQNKLSLDAKLSDLAPEIHFVNPWEKTDPVRLVHLIEHTTGWPDIGTRILAQDGKDWTVRQGLDFSSAGFVSRWKPGTFTVYDNAGPAVAGYAIEKASGQSFDDYTRDHVLRPMGMPTADFALTDDLAARMAKSYAADGTPTPYQYIVLKPAGSLTVSAKELAQLVRFFVGRGTVDGTRILTPDSVDRIERADSNLGAKFGFMNAYGLGNSILPDSGPTFRGHNGSIDSFTSVMGYNLRSGSGYVLLANGGEGVDFATPAAHLIQAYLTRGLPLDPPPTVSIDPAELANYAGFYRLITPSNDLMRPYGEILGLSRVSVKDGHLVVGGHDFLPVGQHSFRRDDRQDATLAFVEENGSVFKIGAFSAQRKEPLWRVGALFLVEAVLGLGTLLSLVMLIPWLIAAARGRLRDRGGLTMRLIPLAGMAALIVMGALPLLAFTGSGTSAVLSLARIGPYSLAVFAGSVIYPLLGALGLILAVRRREAGRFARGLVGTTSAALLCVAGYAATIGWIALRTWVM